MTVDEVIAKIIWLTFFWPTLYTICIFINFVHKFTHEFRMPLYSAVFFQNKLVQCKIIFLHNINAVVNIVISNNINSEQFASHVKKTLF